MHVPFLLQSPVRDPVMHLVVKSPLARPGWDCSSAFLICRELDTFGEHWAGILRNVRVLGFVRCFPGIR